MYFHLYWNHNDSKNVVLGTKLPTPLQNATNYEIAVLETSISTAFNNMPSNKFIRFVTNDGTDVREELPGLRYEDANEINTDIKNLIKKHKLEKMISISKSGPQTTWTLQPGMQITMTDDLKNALGLQNTLLKSFKQARKFYGICDPHDNFRRIFLKTDIITPSDHINNTQLPILASIPINFETDMCTERFGSPVYSKINNNRLENIQVMLIDEKGRQLTSASGSAYCLMHMRSTGCN